MLKNLMLGAYLRNDRHGVARDLDKCIPYSQSSRRAPASRPITLSGGEQQMLAIGRATHGRSNSAAAAGRAVGESHQRLKIVHSIRTIQQAGTAVLLVEQDARSTLAIAKHVYVLEHGRVVRQGNTRTLADDDEIRRIYLAV